MYYFNSLAVHFFYHITYTIGGGLAHRVRPWMKYLPTWMSKKFKVLNRTVTKVKVKMCVKNERKEGKTDSPI